METSLGGAQGRTERYPYTGQASARMVLGARLRRLREAAGISAEDAANAIRASRSKICRLELGRTGFKARDVGDLLTLYGVGDDAERATMLALTEHANAASWWQEYADVVPSWLEQYLDLERVASLVRTYQVQYIPGLLQTADYARAVMSGSPYASDLELDRRVELRLRRQQILYAQDPVRLWAVIDEAALRRPIGGIDVMRAQIRHLIEASRLHHVNIQVLPLSAGGHAAGGGCITMLRFSEAELADVVYLEQLLSSVYLSRPGESAHYRDVLNRLAAQAEHPNVAPTTLEHILATL
ncbi:MAG: helix-turn-helix domain-containing protein [Streptosporangiaceae bacterium]|nr:helix-turn-helix domain-containing protein [Streptosporangiaceae bacterium]